MWTRLRRTLPTGVTCPGCREGELVAAFGCLQTSFDCPGCGGRYPLERLARVLDEDAFARLADLVGERLSDRV